MKNISIVIVNYNVKCFLKNCIQSCLDATQDFDTEIIIIDNNSSDNSNEFITKLFSQIIWIQNQENLGFSKACNQGAEKANGKYLLFLNPDTLLPKDIFIKIIPFANNSKKFGALGVRMVDEKGKFRLESKRNIPNPINSFYKLFNFKLFKSDYKGYYNNDLKEFEIGEIEILSGAFFFTPKYIYQDAGGFDEAYFMYGEDIDLSYTILNLGYSNYYYGQSTIIHYKGESTLKNKTYYQLFFKAMEIFIHKYYQKSYFIYPSLLLGLKIKYYLSLFKYNLRKI